MEILTNYFISLSDGKKIIEENFINWTSGNEKIDNFIREKQLKYREYDFDTAPVFEWVPYNEFINIKEIGDNCLIALWNKGPLFYDKYNSSWYRKSYEKVVLRFLYNSQNADEFLTKVLRFFYYC
jgi:hypothetical protein